MELIFEHFNDKLKSQEIMFRRIIQQQQQQIDEMRTLLDSVASSSDEHDEAIFHLQEHTGINYPDPPEPEQEEPVEEGIEIVEDQNIE